VLGGYVARMSKNFLAIAFLVCAFSTFAQPSPLTTDQNVTWFGAVADGKTDNTAFFQTALDATAKTGGRVIVPAGRYVIRGHLNIPESVELCGSFDAPARSNFSTGTLEKEKGTILLAYEGKGDETGEPFITLNRASHLHGLIIFYPEQTVPPVEYPWTIRGHGDNCTITAVEIINPYQAVDFGTNPCGRHYINGLYAQALKTGLVIDKCFDVGRIENVHFWPFWKDEKKLLDWTKENGRAFVIARTDWEYMTNCFCLAYSIGYHFIAHADGGGNVIATQCGSDLGPLAVKVDTLQDHSGASFSNSQFMSRVVVEPTNRGPLKFTSCGFWGIEEADDFATLRGPSQTTFTACHFTAWARQHKDAFAIVAEAGGLTVNGCEFVDAGKNQIELKKDVESAIITSNRFRGGDKIKNESKGDVQIGFNTKR
jgi:hypothetical protein